MEQVISDNGSVSDWEHALENMKAELLAWPVLEVDLAWQPEAAFVEELGQTLARIGLAPARLTVRYAPEILGGLVVGYQGKQYNLSLARDLEQIDEHLPTIIG